MYHYKVVDPNGEFDEVELALPFSIDPTKQAAYVVMSRYSILMTLAVEKMLGARICESDLEMVERLTIRLEHESVVRVGV